MPTSRTVTARLSFRKGSTADWAANDPILQDSEPAWDSTLRALKIGDGVRGWSEMDYIAKGSPNPNITVADDPGAVNFSNYAQKGNMMFELSSSSLYIATVSATLANIAPRSNFIPADVGKVVILGDTDGDGVDDILDAFPSDASETTDSDSDGVGDNSDYFPNNSNYSQTQAELDAYSLDTFKTPATGDIIKILTDWVRGSVTLNQNTYHIVENVDSSNVKVTIDGVIYYPNFSVRGTKWEIVTP